MMKLIILKVAGGICIIISNVFRKNIIIIGINGGLNHGDDCNNIETNNIFMILNLLNYHIIFIMEKSENNTVFQ